MANLQRGKRKWRNGRLTETAASVKIVAAWPYESVMAALAYRCQQSRQYLSMPELAALNGEEKNHRSVKKRCHQAKYNGVAAGVSW